MPLNTEADIAAFVNPVFEAAMKVARDNNFLPNLVTNFSGRGDWVRKSQIYGTATMTSLAETDDLASQAFTPTALATLTPSEAGGQIFLTDRRIDTDPFQAQRDAAEELGMAMATKMEADLISDFASFTGGTIGAAGTVITWGYVFAMLTALRRQNAPRPYAMVMHPNQYHVLAKAVTPATAVQTNSPAFQDEVMRNFYVGSAAGVDFYTTTNVPIDGSDDAVTAMFSRNALAIDIRRAPRLEPERDASRRGIELNMTSVYAHGVWRAAFGVKGTFDAAAPSS